MTDLRIHQPGDVYVIVEWIVEIAWPTGRNPETIRFDTKEAMLSRFDELCRLYGGDGYPGKPTLEASCESTTAVTFALRDLEAEAAVGSEPTEHEAGQ